MRVVVAEFNAYRWVGEMLTDAARLGANQDVRYHHQASWPTGALAV
jgi:hypothetical protein